MFITIDSNVLNLAEMIAEKMPLPSARWCTKFNKCYDLKDVSDYNIFFNTPISMSNDPTYYYMPKKAIHFVYVDFDVYAEQLKQILTNLELFQNVVIISNGKTYKMGQYILYTGNCTLHDIADVISGIILIHLRRKRVVDEQEMISILCNRPYNMKETTNKAITNFDNTNNDHPNNDNTNNSSHNSSDSSSSSSSSGSSSSSSSESSDDDDGKHDKKLMKYKKNPHHHHHRRRRQHYHSNSDRRNLYDDNISEKKKEKSLQQIHKEIPQQAHYNIYNILEAKRALYGEIEDCHECIVSKLTQQIK